MAALGEGHILREHGAEGRDGDRAKNRFTGAVFRPEDEIGDARDDGQAKFWVDERATHAERLPEYFGERLAGVIARHAEGDG